MITSFRTFVGIKVLEYFLLYPTAQTYLNELARKLQISPRSAKIYCDIFDKEGIILREIKGNVHIFKTNNDYFRVREMKRAYGINVLADLNIEKIAEGCASIAIYGSYASGTYDEKSDIDILIIGDEKQVKRELVVDIMKKTEKEIQLTIISIIKWEKMKKENDHFTKNILKNHVLIKGVEL